MTNLSMWFFPLYAWKIVLQDTCSIAICNHLNSADIWIYCNNWCFEEFKPPKKLPSLLIVEEQYDGISTKLQECPTLGEHHPCLFTLYWKRQMGNTEGQPVVWLLFSPIIDSNMKPSYDGVVIITLSFVQEIWRWTSL